MPYVREIARSWECLLAWESVFVSKLNVVRDETEIGKSLGSGAALARYLEEKNAQVRSAQAHYAQDATCCVAADQAFWVDVL